METNMGLSNPTRAELFEVIYKTILVIGSKCHGFKWLAYPCSLGPSAGPWGIVGLETHDLKKCVDKKINVKQEGGLQVGQQAETKYHEDFVSMTQSESDN